MVILVFVMIICMYHLKFNANSFLDCQLMQFTGCSHSNWFPTWDMGQKYCRSIIWTRATTRLYKIMLPHLLRPWSISAPGLIDIWSLSRPANENEKLTGGSLVDVDEANLYCCNLFCHFHRGALPLVDLSPKDQVDLVNKLTNSTHPSSSISRMLWVEFKEHLEHRRVCTCCALFFLHCLIFFNQPVNIGK